MHGLESSGWHDRITAISQFRKRPETVTFAGCADHTSPLDLATRKGQSRQSSIAFRGTADDSESENRVAVLRLNDEIGVFWALERPELTSLKKANCIRLLVTISHLAVFVAGRRRKSSLVLRKYRRCNPLSGFLGTSIVRLP